MKAINRSAVNFQPITVELIIESKEELDAIKALCNTNVSVPSAVIENSSYSNRKQLVDILETISKSLK